MKRAKKKIAKSAAQVLKKGRNVAEARETKPHGVGPRRAKVTRRQLSKKKTHSRAISKHSVVGGNGSSSTLTVGDILVHLMPDYARRNGKSAAKLMWPPDAFALVASVLKHSGAYTELVAEWPPVGIQNLSDWKKKISAIAKAWKALPITPGTFPPKEIVDWWNHIAMNKGMPLRDVRNNQSVLVALSGILASADQACEGFGVIPSGKISDFMSKALSSLSSIKASLCENIDSSRAVVLPKFHNPVAGITIRSCSHHLALWEKPEVKAEWYVTPMMRNQNAMNMLLLPWPLEILPSSFREVELSRLQVPPHIGSFTCDGVAKIDWKKVIGLIAAAERKVGTIDAVVFPEASMSEAAFNMLRDKLEQPLLIAGVGEEARGGEYGLNKVCVAIKSVGQDVKRERNKHHKWRIDRNQVRQYGLGRSLSGKDKKTGTDRKSWWEAIKVGERRCLFFGANDWFTFCPLICEDLARQDPVAELVRSVGPNLVIALLMDGPQIPERWSAHYATVLADDPRSSVLTLASAGMVDLSNAQRKDGGVRSIGLWKDADSSTQEILLDKGAEAVVLCLNSEENQEWTADGRDDDSTTEYLRLRGIHQVYPPEKGAKLNFGVSGSKGKPMGKKKVRRTVLQKRSAKRKARR